MAEMHGLAPAGCPSPCVPRFGAPTPASAGEQPVAYHDFRYPGSEFRVCLFAGRLLPLPASLLVREAYSRLGYILRDEPRQAEAEPATGAVLQALRDDRTLGTLSINLDSAAGLSADALYRNEVDAFRTWGRSCEFTRLALDTEHAGREVLCSLFYTAYVFSHIVHRARHLFVEVHPRHQCFYERLLGFRRVGEERWCRRVNAPAVLLHLDFQFTREQIRKFRQGLSMAAGTMLYRYAIPVAEEHLLVRRLTAAS